MNISARRTFTLLSAVAFVLFVLSLVTQANNFFWGISFPGDGLVMSVAEMDSELSLNNTFATLLLFIAAVLLAFVSFYKRQSKDPFRAQWLALSLVFFYLTFDEGSALHDRLTPLIRDALNLGGFFYQSWVVLALVILVILALYFFRFLMHLPAKTRNRYLIAACLYVGGALVLEMFAGRHEEIYGAQTFERILFYSTEETLELLGLILFIYTTLRYLYNLNPRLELSIDP